MRSLILAAVAAASLLAAPSAFAFGYGKHFCCQRHVASPVARCRDTHGRFEACPVHGLAPACRKGKPCGNTCIALDKVCHIH